MEEEETGLLFLKEIHEKYKTDALVLLSAALVRTLRQWTGQQAIEVEMESHGRHIEDIDVSRTIGWFTAIYPINVNRDDKTIGDEIKSVKEAIRKIPNSGIGYGILNYMTEKEEKPEARRAVVRFNYLGQFDQEVDNPLFAYIDQSTGPDVSLENHMTAAIEINAMIIKGILSMDIQYNKQAFKEEAMDSFRESYVENLREISDHIKQEDNVHFTPSDFDTVDLGEDDLEALFG